MGFYVNQIQENHEEFTKTKEAEFHVDYKDDVDLRVSRIDEVLKES